MKIAVISFTKAGTELCRELKDKLETTETECTGYIPNRFQDKESPENGLSGYEESIGTWTKKHFDSEDALVFIGAAGIAVRAIAPFLKDKYTDPAVLVVDEKGKHVISLVSGHIGGANALAERVADLIGGKAVITTASDVNGIEAIDVWAKKYDLVIGSRDTAKKAAAAILEGRKISFSVDRELRGWWDHEARKIPDGCTESMEMQNDHAEGDDTNDYSEGFGTDHHSESGINGNDMEECQIRIRVTFRTCSDPWTLCLHPKILSVGVGCRKNIDLQVLKQNVKEMLNEAGIAFSAVKELSSIDLKKDEAGLLELAHENDLPFYTYSAKQLADVPGDFAESDFVRKTTGIGNVCERAACKAADCGSGANLILKKQKKDGVTLAAAIPYFDRGKTYSEATEKKLHLKENQAAEELLSPAASVLIFGGTTEGRQLAQWLAASGIHTLVSVATEYGEEVLKPHPLLQVRTGRLDDEQMKNLVRKCDPIMVIDATHPYAVEVTKKIRSVCQNAEKEYLRVLRKESVLSQEEASSLIRVETVREAADYLKNTEGTIFLSTGSKELPVFAEDEAMRQRLIARVLPSEKVLHECAELGLVGKQLIAMQGPFSVEMNLVMLQSAGAVWMVTKESGANSGYREKLEAAHRLGVKTIVIGRPTEEQGISLQQAKRLLSKRFSLDSTYEKNIRTITLIGLGMGKGDQLTREALEALKESQAVFGASRMLDDVSCFAEQAKKVPMYQGAAICDYLREHEEYQNAAVVFSGDTGYHSGAKGMTDAVWQHFAKEIQSGKLKLKICPGISTVAALCARFHTDWTDLYLTSAHGRDCDVIQLLMQHRRIFLLLGGTLKLHELCSQLVQQDYGEKVWIHAGFRLGYDDEKLIEGYAGHLKEIPEENLAAAILELK